MKLDHGPIAKTLVNLLCVSKEVSARVHECVGLIEIMHPATVHGVGVITKQNFAIFAIFRSKESIKLIPYRYATHLVAI